MRIYKEFRSRQTESERAFVRAALARCNWRCGVTAGELDIPESTLVSVIKRLGLWDRYRQEKQRRKEQRRKAK